jgi:hypothetical protein
VAAGCSKTINVVRVGVDCPMAGASGAKSFLPFGRWLRAEYPRFGDASQVQISEGGRPLGKVSAACVSPVVPPGRAAYLTNSRIGYFASPDADEPLATSELEVGQRLRIEGTGKFVVAIEKDLPRGLVKMEWLTTEPVEFFAKSFDEIAWSPTPQDVDFKAVATLAPEILSNPRVRAAIQRVMDVFRKRSRFHALRGWLQDMGERLVEFPDLAGMACDLEVSPLPEKVKRACKLTNWALVVSTAEQEEGLVPTQEDVTARLRGPLSPLWNNDDRWPGVFTAETLPGLPQDRVALVLGVCHQTQAEALRALYAAFLPKLSLVEIHDAVKPPPCPSQPRTPKLGKFPDGTRLEVYESVSSTLLSSSLVAMAYDKADNLVSTWYPKTALDLGPIDYNADVTCKFSFPEHNLFTIDAECNDRRGESPVEQLGTLVLECVNGKLKAKVAKKGKRHAYTPAPHFDSSRL